MSSSEIKSITITGGAALGVSKRRSTGITRKRKNALHVGGNESSSQSIVISKGADIPSQIALPLQQLTNVPPPPVISGGVSEPKIKVKIAPKRRTHRIVLVKKHGDTLPLKPKRKNTIKKISITTEKLHNKLKRANITRKAAQNLSIDDIKKHLLHKKIIKGGSSAPPELLRKMYEDSMIVAGSEL